MSSKVQRQKGDSQQKPGRGSRILGAGLALLLATALFLASSVLAVAAAESSGLSNGETIILALTPTPTPQRPITYVVRPGDTLFSIAQRYSTTVEAIVQANGLTDPNLLAVGQELVIPAPTGPLPARTTWTVGPGETLAGIARRYGIAVQEIARRSGLVNPAQLYVGQSLAISDAEMEPRPGGLYVVRPGETLLSIALRHRLSPWLLVQVNGLPGLGPLLAGQPLYIPGQEPVTPTLPFPFLTADLKPVPAVRGETVRLAVRTEQPVTLTGRLGDTPLTFAREGDAYYALAGIYAMASPGLYPLVLTATTPLGEKGWLETRVLVTAGDYAREQIILPPDRAALLDPEVIRAERERMRALGAIFTPQRYWQGRFQKPVDNPITSRFGTRRSYNGGPYTSFHGGTDFYGLTGDPVRAPAAGVVVLAEPLQVRGNAIVLDHGWGVYTGYWHLSVISVTVGQRVEPGQVIGAIGSTGLSTGSHLHWEMWVNNVAVNALQWTEEPFP